MKIEPWSLGFLRRQWVEKITEHRQLQSDQTEMRAIMAERRYVFAWRRWQLRLLGKVGPQVVKHPDPVVGWSIVR